MSTLSSGKVGPRVRTRGSTRLVSPNVSPSSMRIGMWCARKKSKQRRRKQRIRAKARRRRRRHRRRQRPLVKTGVNARRAPNKHNLSLRHHHHHNLNLNLNRNRSHHHHHRRWYRVRKRVVFDESRIRTGMRTGIETHRSLCCKKRKRCVFVRICEHRALLFLKATTMTTTNRKNNHLCLRWWNQDRLLQWCLPPRFRMPMCN
mmetsp:Transcript_19531/g.31022  ORF Transcript_19531/g.31022 Transcript_19531/m.31022 type:complete len:203 (+) Transcript_19531:246-854(+)